MSSGQKSVPELEGVVSASDLVELQSGAVVSRTLIKKASGTVTVFAFDAGEGLSEHTAPFDALVLGLEGEADVSISGAPHHVSAGQIVKLPAGKPHAVKAATPFKMLLIMIREQAEDTRRVVKRLLELKMSGGPAATSAR